MGLFDRWKRHPAPEATATVPAGHEVRTYTMSAAPRVARAAGGVVIACLGASSDALETDLDALLEQLVEMLRAPGPQVLMPNVAGPLSSLFAPANPAVIPVASAVAWVLDAEGLAGAERAPFVAQRLLRGLHQVRDHAEPRPAQTVYLANASSPRGRKVADLVAGLGFPVRTPVPPEGAFLVEVHRPEGIVVSALLGEHLTPAEPGERHARDVNDEKDRAEGEGDAGRLARIEEEERAELTRRLAPVGGEPEVASVELAPRLRGLILAAAGDAAARRALHDELLARRIPLLVMVDAKTKSASLRQWPGNVVAMPAYADRASFLRALRDTGQSPQGVAAAEMAPRALFAWAVQHQWAVALGAYRAPDEPVYVLLPADEVRALARGRAPG
jgi:hypothetical protein